MFSKEIYQSRRAELSKRVPSGGLILLPGNGEASMNYPNNVYHFRQDSSFLYFFGLQLPDMIGVIDIDNGTETLYGDDITIDDVIWTGPQPTISELGSRCGVADTKGLSSLWEQINLAIRKGRRVHFLPPYRAENKLRISDLLGVKASSIGDYISVELAIAIVSLRDKKGVEEIEEIDRACRIGYDMHTTAMKMCREGVVEREIAGAIEGVAMQYGGGTSFPSIVSQHGETLHNHCYDGVLERGRLLLVDAGAQTTMGYASDFTRTIPVGGKFTQQQKDIYNIVLAANSRAFELSSPGKLYKDIHLESAKVLIDGLKSLGLMKGDTDAAVAAGAHALFMPHGLGHMMGLDVHDMENIGEKYVGYDLETERSTQLGVSSLRMGRRLEAGMVMTVEPGIYFIPALIEKWNGEGLNSQFINFDKLDPYLNFGGIRIEDDLLITEGGNRMLGKERIPVTVEEIEEFMRINL